MRAREYLSELREEGVRSRALVPGLLLVAIFAVWAYRDGGYAVVDWGPGALFALSLVVVLAFVAPTRFEVGLATALAFAFLAAFTLWGYLTIAWAEVPADAWTSANRTFLYLCVFTVFALQSWRPRGAAAILGTFAVAVWGVAMLTFLRLAASDTPAASFLEGRLADPIRYANATCALYVIAALPALHLAARREVPVVLRGVFLAAAGTLGQLALLTQSRASLLAVPIVLAIYLLLVPGRVRSLAALAVVGVTIALTVPRLLDVYEAISAGGDGRSALANARTAIVSSAIALFLVGLCLGLLDRRIRVEPRRATVARRSIGALATVTVVVAATVGLMSMENPVDRATAAWDEFRAGEYVSDPTTPHLTSGFGSGRYKLWQVAFDQFREHPLIGVGGDNYAVAYLRERDDQSQPLYPHSLVLRTLAQTGLVGSLLFLAFLVAAGCAAWPRIRRGTHFARGISGTAIAMFAYWLIHGSIDWFWEMPVLGAPAFAFLALATRTADAPADDPDVRPGRTGTSRLAFAGLGVVVLLAAASLSLPWLSAREVNAAVSTWRADPESAYSRLERARALNPLSDEPDIIASVIASSSGDEARQERALRAALARNPSNWYPMIEMAALETRRARPRLALAWLERAETVNPREPTIEYVRQEIDQGQPVTSAVLQGMYVRQASLLTGARQSW